MVVNTAHRDITQRYAVKEYPTLLLFGRDGSWQRFKGNYGDAASITAAINAMVHPRAQTNLNSPDTIFDTQAN